MSDKDLVIFEGGPWDGKERLRAPTHGFIHAQIKDAHGNVKTFTYRSQGKDDEGRWVYRLERRD